MRRILALIVTVLVFTGLMGAHATTSPAPDSTLPSAQATVTPNLTTQPADQALVGLSVKGRAPKTGYTRNQFGAAWHDVDANGCDTRNDILLRDLVGVTLRSDRCTVQTGTLNDPYTGKTIEFRRGVVTSLAVQVDHVVALSNAWQTGAQRLSVVDRLRFANDPLNLLAVDGPTNEAKSDGDAATWLPTRKAARCSYVARQIAVKAKYRLWVTAAEKAAMARILAACPNQSLPTS